MKKTVKKTFSFILISFSLFIVATPVFALELNYPSFGGINLANVNAINGLIAWLYYLIISIAGLAAFVMIVWGGVQYLTSAGDPGRMGDAQDRLYNAVLGLIIILTSYLIMKVVNPELLLLNLPPLPESTTIITKPPLTQGIRLYDSAGDQTYTELQSGVTNLGANLNDKVSAVEVAPGYAAVLYNDTNSGGAYRVIFSNGGDLVLTDDHVAPGQDLGNTLINNNWNDRASSVRVIPNFNSVTLFLDTNYGGSSLMLSVGDFILKDKTFSANNINGGNVTFNWDNAVSSIYIPLGYTVTVYDGIFTGTSQKYTGSALNFGSLLNDKISSVRITSP